MDTFLLGLGVFLSAIVVAWSFRLERKFREVLDILQQPEPRTHNLTYLEMVRLLGTADYFIAKRDSWPEGTYLKYTGDTLLRKYKGSVFEGYFGCPEDVEARDWLVFQGSPLRP